MSRFPLPAAALAFLLALAAAAGSANAVSLSEKAALQAAMQVYVDQQTVGGVFLYLDKEKGEARALHPVTAHPMIFTMGPHYVLCFDFRDAAGAHVNIDFYMARKGSSYVVFHAAVADHASLDKLIAAGKVRKPD